MNITDNNITYVLPFDGIDINYITTKTNFPYDEVSLWNGRRNSPGKYNKVEIMAQKKVESDDHKTDNENGLKDPMFQCQVCNISIPLGYKKQHKLSPKHKTCLKILESAIDRAKNLILSRDDQDSVKPAPDSYFCEPCAIAVKTLKWEEHELSKEHFKSLQYDRFLNDLLLIYVDKGHLDNVEFEYMTTTNKNCDEEKSESRSNVDSESANDDVTRNGLNDPMFQCQVCNISTPLGYKKQHKLSPKHKTCLKILEAAIDRAKNLILSRDDQDSVKPAPDSYFCEPCAIAVKILKWEEHELSKEHFKSLQHDRFLNDLLLIYVDKGKFDIVDFEYMTKNCDEEKIESNSNVDSESANDDVTEVDDFMNLMQYLENVDKDEKILKANEETGITVEKDKNCVISLKDYIEILNNNSHSSLSPKLAVKGDKLELATSDKSVIYLSEDNFHGFSKKNFSNRIRCKLCDSVFIDKNEHKMSPEHMKKVMTPISDMHGIRQFQGNQYKHCVLCNESIYNFDEHKTSEAHINILRNALSHKNVNNEESTTTAKKPSRTYCSPCNVYIDTHNFAGHTKGKTHKENVASVSNEINNTPTLSPHVSTDTAKKTFCAPCNIYLHTNNLSSHLNGQIHKSNMSQYKSRQNESHKTKLFTSLTNIDPCVNSKIGKICRVCNVSITPSEKNLKKHCQGNTHTINIENLLSKYKIKRLNNKLVCGKCKQQFDVKSFLDHIETHEGKKVPSKLRLCRICNVHFPDTSKALDVHKNSVKHTNNLEGLQHPHLEFYYYDYDDYDVKCSVCNIDIDLLESKAHVKSQSHLQEFNRLVIDNKVLIREGLYICTLCSLVVNDEALFIDHIIGNPIHKERIDYDHKSIECIFCNVEVPYSQKSIAQHENGRLHKENYKDILERLNFENSCRNEVLHISNQTYVIYI